MDLDSDEDLFVKRTHKESTKKSKTVRTRRNNSKKRKPPKERRVLEEGDLNKSTPLRFVEEQPQEPEDTIESIYCPACQAPLHYLKISPQVHASMCCVDWRELSECPEGQSCVHDSIFHFRDFAHTQLAEYRSTRGFVSPRVKRLPPSKSKSKKTPASFRKLSQSAEIKTEVNHEAKEKVKRKLDLDDPVASSSRLKTESESSQSDFESNETQNNNFNCTLTDQGACTMKEKQAESPPLMDCMKERKPNVDTLKSSTRKRKSSSNEIGVKEKSKKMMSEASIHPSSSKIRNSDQKFIESNSQQPTVQKRKTLEAKSLYFDEDYKCNPDVESMNKPEAASTTTNIKSLGSRNLLRSESCNFKSTSAETGSDSDNNSHRKVHGTLTDSQLAEFSLGSNVYSQPCSTPSISEAPDYLVTGVGTVKIKREVKAEHIDVDPLNSEDLFLNSQDYQEEMPGSNRIKEERDTPEWPNSVPSDFSASKTHQADDDTLQGQAFDGPEATREPQSSSDIKIDSGGHVKSERFKATWDPQSSSSFSIDSEQHNKSEGPTPTAEDLEIPELSSDEDFERCFEKYNQDSSKKAEVQVNSDESSNDSSISRNNLSSKKQETSKSLWKQILKPKTVPANSSVSALRKQKVFSKSRVVINETEPEERNVAELPQRKCPFYKRIPDTTFVVDAFSYGVIPGVTSYFLSHFHSDHYIGLRKSFNKPIYCSKITASLVNMKIGVKEEFLRVLNLGEPRIINGVEVTTLDANHCPGAVMFLFRLIDNRQYLHVGDFRACREMESEPILKKAHITALFLDTTYCNPQYTFPLQKDIIQMVVQAVEKKLSECPKLLVVCGSYTIGKEKVFLGILERFGNWKLWALPPKQRVLKVLENNQISSKLISNPQEANVHVLKMGELKFQFLEQHLSKMKGAFSHVLAFKPTGWEMGKGAKFNILNPISNRNITICGVPYSEHSSYSELSRFTQFIAPEKVIPTVNVGNASMRTRMTNIINKWLQKPEPDKQPKLNTFLLH